MCPFTVTLAIGLALCAHQTEPSRFHVEPALVTWSAPTIVADPLVLRRPATTLGLALPLFDGTPSAWLSASLVTTPVAPTWPGEATFGLNLVVRF